MKSTWLYIIFFVFFNIAYSYLAKYLLITDELYFNALAEQMSFEQIQKTLDQTNQWSWLPYIILPIYYLLKFTVITAILSLGYYFLTNKWLFNPVLRVAILSEFILLIPSLIKLLWFLFIQTDYTLNDLQLFYPLSLLNLFEPDTVEPYLLYPLQVLNVFEVAYWFALAYGVARVMNASLERGFGLVMASYGSGLVLWVVLVMFLTVSLS